MAGTGRCQPGTNTFAMNDLRAEPGTDAANSLTAKDFAAQFSAAFPRLWGLAAALISDRNEAEDLVQEAALVALKKLDTFTPGSNFQAWMARIVRMHALNYRRKRASRCTAATNSADIDQTHEAAATTELQPDVALRSAAAGDTTNIQESLDDVLLNSLDELDQVARACLLLRVVYSLSYDEISEMLEIPPGTAMSHVHRSKRLLRKKMSSEDSPPDNSPPKNM